jgi:hypothetical protein
MKIYIFLFLIFNNFYGSDSSVDLYGGTFIDYLKTSIDFFYPESSLGNVSIKFFIRQVLNNIDLSVKLINNSKIEGIDDIYEYFDLTFLIYNYVFLKISPEEIRLISKKTHKSPVEFHIVKKFIHFFIEIHKDKIEIDKLNKIIIFLMKNISDGEVKKLLPMIPKLFKFCKENHTNILNRLKINDIRPNDIFLYANLVKKNEDFLPLLRINPMELNFNKKEILLLFKKDIQSIKNIPTNNLYEKKDTFIFQTDYNELTRLINQEPVYDFERYLINEKKIMNFKKTENDAINFESSNVPIDIPNRSSNIKIYIPNDELSNIPHEPISSNIKIDINNGSSLNSQPNQSDKSNWVLAPSVLLFILKKTPKSTKTSNKTIKIKNLDFKDKNFYSSQKNNPSNNDNNSTNILSSHYPSIQTMDLSNDKNLSDEGNYSGENANNYP